MPESFGAFLCEKIWVPIGRGVGAKKCRNLENQKFGDFGVRSTSGADFDCKIDVSFALRAMF